MAHENDLIEDNIEPETDNDLKINIDSEKIDARRRLEEYMEMKKLRELTEF